jgi:hypothetical protein
MVSKYVCAVCGKTIEGEHLMAINHHWKGFCSPPKAAIVHVCCEECAKKSEDFERPCSPRLARR